MAVRCGVASCWVKPQQHLSADGTAMDSVSLRLSETYMKVCFYWSGLVQVLVGNQFSRLANCRADPHVVWHRASQVKRV